jgi:hypothetical protein
MAPPKRDSILGSAQPKSTISEWRPRRRTRSSFAVIANEAKFARRTDAAATLLIPDKIETIH